MTETLDRSDADTAAGTVERWLSAFEEALTRGDRDAAAAMFLDDSYWRDLVAFTWNITTVEGPAGVRDMLAQTLPAVAPRGFTVEQSLGGATGADG